MMAMLTLSRLVSDGSVQKTLQCFLVQLVHSRDWHGKFALWTWCGQFSLYLVWPVHVSLLTYNT